jgi:predicted  nucleic acid-binding Zn-ribbon protein
LKKLGPWKSQLELQKKQIAEVQSALDEERRRADKFELQHKNIVERNEALTLEKEVNVRNNELNCPAINAVSCWSIAFDRGA